MNTIIDSNRQEILALAAKNGVKNVRVFGSMVRDDAHPGSDVDLLVELEAGKTGFALGGFLMDIQDLLNRQVDVVTVNALYPAIREQVLSEAQPL
jgi:predicted nucleotidyltransferase